MRDAWRRPLRALSVGVLALSGIAAGGGVLIGSQILTSGSASATPPACTVSWKTAASGNWDTAANWSPARVPGATDVACITVAGTYTVTYQPAAGTETVDALVVGSGVATNQETLAIQGTCGDNVTLITTNASSGTDTDLIASTGHLSLTNSTCGNNATLAVGSTLVNQGTLSSDGAGGTRTLSGNVTNNGAVDVNFGLTYNTGTWDNAGALDLADGEALTATTSPATFTNDTGGSVVSSGSSHTGQLVVDAGNTYNQGNGTTSGEPVFLNGPASGGAIALHYTGTGTSTVVAQGGAGTVDGNLSSGQTLDVQGTCGNNATETLDQSLTNAGIINVTNVTCGNDSNLVVTATDTLTNTGTLETGGAGGVRSITGNVTNEGIASIGYSASLNSGTWDNKGALDIADSESLTVGTSPATFTNDTGGAVVSSGASHTGQLVIDGGDVLNQGNGTTSGEPVLLNGPASGAGIALHYTGTGASSLVAQGAGDTVDGNIVTGQTLTVQGTCGNDAITTVDHNESNAGVVNLTSSTCGNTSTLTVKTGDTLTNAAAGTLAVLAGSGGARTITGNVTNKGTVNIGANTTYTTGTWLNEGPLDVATSTSVAVPLASGSTFTNSTGGTVAGTGSGVLQVNGGNTFNQGAGTTSGTEPVLLSGPGSGTGVALHYTGTGASIITTEGVGTVDGTMANGQVLDVLGVCGNNAVEELDASMKSAGTIDLSSVTCGNTTTLSGKSAKGKDILTVAKHGVLQTDPGSGGVRTISTGVVLSKGTFNVNTATTYTAGTKKGFNNSKGTLNIASSEVLTVTGVTHSVFADTKGHIAGTGQLLVNGPTTFNQGLGTITGVNVLVQGGSLEYSGTGTGTIETEGTTTLVSPPLAAGQILDVNGTCGNNGNLTASGNVTDLGAIELTSTTCGNSSTVSVPAGDALTIGSTGALSWPATSGGPKSISGNLVDDGTIGNSGVAGVTVSGTLTFGSGGTYAPSVTTSSSDSITATGGGTLGGTLAPSGTFTASQNYTILNGAFTANFSTFGSGWSDTVNPTNVTMKHA